MRLIRDEIERDMRLMGCSKLDQLKQSMLVSRRD
jgi:isopentenyl diphosphate isomerase/L-lactate dehydrogenase-like FMN-dependent dehydrogenase